MINGLRLYGMGYLLNQTSAGKDKKGPAGERKV